MKAEFVGVDGKMQTVQAEMEKGFDLLLGLGPDQAYEVSEKRRKWLLSVFKTRSIPPSWLPELAGTFPDKTAPDPVAAAIAELSCAFVPFRLPQILTVTFTDVPSPLGPDCPSWTWPLESRVHVRRDLVATMSIMTIEQMAVHELIHACEKNLDQPDTIPRMNWAGVGAILRAAKTLAVNCDDGRRLTG
jgi:hypothetical protein